MKRIFALFVLFCLCLFAKAYNTTLCYSAPSQKWMGALPLGNGRIGAMVFGGTHTETIALNEVTLWSGQPDSEVNNVCGPERLKELRQLFLKGDIAGDNALGWQSLNGHPRTFGTHLPLGDLKIEMTNDGNETATGYSRKLDMEHAMAHVSYNSGGVKYMRDYFTSNPAQVLVVHYQASGRGNINARVSLSLLRHHAITAEGDRIVALGDARFDKNGEGGVNYMEVTQVLTDGTVSADGETLTVTGANYMTLVTDIRTDFHNPDYQSQCESTVDKAVRLGYRKLLGEHKRDFSRLFDRMSIRLGSGREEDLSTDTLFVLAHAGKPSPEFDDLFLQYGRYMLISCSRNDSPLPGNLQGIWNDNLACNMPWTCDYHLDINIQQNYWSANIANMPECNEPLFKYIALLAKHGHETAQQMYGCNGWVAHTINNVWGETSPGSSLNWALNVTAGAWLATHLWTHYDYTRDINYLRTIGYPLLKQTAQFFVDYMVFDPKTGWLLTGPSISPENTFRYVDGKDYSLSMMPTIDRAVVFEIYHACIEAAKILGIDDNFRARLEHDIRLLPPLQVGDDGALKEWLLDVHRSDPAHRHASHLLALYPFGQISPSRTPALAEGCRRFLDLQTNNGTWEDTEWSRGNMINFYARLKDGEEAYKSIIGLYTGFMRENLMTVSPAGVAGAEENIFSFDATEAALAGACEMILQSYDGCLDFLPALPKAWNDGSVRGICARGAITADIDWREGRVTHAVLRTPIPQTVTLHINGEVRQLKLRKGSNKVL